MVAKLVKKEDIPDVKRVDITALLEDGGVKIEAQNYEDNTCSMAMGEVMTAFGLDPKKAQYKPGHDREPEQVKNQRRLEI